MTENNRTLELLGAVVTDMQELCSAVRQNTALSKNNAILLKRYMASLKDSLLERGIENVSDIVEENTLLLEQNAILVEQRERDTVRLLNLQEKLDTIRNSSRIGKEASAG